MATTPALRLIIDAVSIALAIFLIEAAFVFISFDREVNLQRIASRAFVGFLFYFLLLCVFTRLGRNMRFFPTLFAITLASVLWGFYDLILLIDADFYLSQHPEAFWGRTSKPALFIFGIFVPIYTVTLITIILLIRLVTGAKSEPDPEDIK